MSINFNEIKKWAIESENIEYQTPIFTLKRRKMKSRIRDKSSDFYIIEAPDWVNILALTEDEQVIMVKQYRHGIDDITIEIPGGAMDPDDTDPQKAAQRERLEETGLQSSNWEYLGAVSSNPAIFNNVCHFYLAKQCVNVSEQNLDPFEEIEVSTMPLKQFLEKVDKGIIHHSLIVAAVAKYLLNNFGWNSK